MDNSEISKERADEIFGALKRKCPSLECPICKCKTFNLVASEVFLPLPMRGENNIILAPSRGRKCVAQICNNCGNTLIFDLDTLFK